MRLRRRGQQRIGAGEQKRIVNTVWLFALICRLAYRKLAAVDILATGSLPAVLRENVFVAVGAWRDGPYHD